MHVVFVLSLTPSDIITRNSLSRTKHGRHVSERGLRFPLPSVTVPSISMHGAHMQNILHAP